ncbi:flavin reductase family protein [Salibacterium sp. K-3]
MHKTIEPNILYFGTPVVLISTLNENGSANLAPMSSAWWLNQSCMLGMSSKSQTIQNLQREQECVLNLPSSELVSAVDLLALLTGKNPVPESKEKIGYRYEPNKFSACELTPVSSDLVNAPLVKECPVQLEAQFVKTHSFEEPSSLVATEVRILRVHIDEELLMGEEKNYINPEEWKPLIMNFCEFFSLGSKIHPSTLAKPFMDAHYNN